MDTYEDNLDKDKRELSFKEPSLNHYQPLDSITPYEYSKEEYLKGLMLVINGFRISKGRLHTLTDYINASKELLDKVEEVRTIEIKLD